MVVIHAMHALAFKPSLELVVTPDFRRTLHWDKYSCAIKSRARSQSGVHTFPSLEVNPHHQYERIQSFPISVSKHAGMFALKKLCKVKR